MGEPIQFISIFLEAVIAILGVLIATTKKKLYGWGITLTFAIYVFYDFVGLFGVGINSSILYWLFFVATASALFVVYTLYIGGKKK